MATIYDSQGRPWGGVVDAYPDAETLASLVEEDRQLMLLVEEKLREHGSTDDVH